MATASATNNATGNAFENAKFELRAAPMDKIRLGKYSLREVDRNSEKYQRLRDAIAATNGPMLPILLREIEDPDNKGKKALGLIDGLQRYSCCLDLGFKTIPARIIDMDDAQVAAAQIIANHSRIDTKPVEYTQQLHRMLNADPTLTLEELSDQLHCSVKWLQDRLSLAKLHEKIGPLVDNGDISLAHAFALVKLKPPEEQLQFVEQAQTQTIQEFSGHVTNRVKELREAARTGRIPSDKAAFQAVPHMRAVREIKAQLESPTLAPAIVKDMKATTPEEGFAAGVAWVLNMDPKSIEISKQQAEDRKKEDEVKKEAKKKENIRKRAEAARAAAADAGISLEMNANEGEEEDEDEDEDDE